MVLRGTFAQWAQASGILTSGLTADIATTIAGESNSEFVTPAGLAGALPWRDIRWHGAVEGAADHSEPFQDASDYLDSEYGGGTILVPDGMWRAANVLLHNAVAVMGAGRSWQYGFTGQGRAAVIKVPDSAPQGSIAGIKVTAGGSSYATAPVVTFTGGGGSDASATAYVSGGAVVFVALTSPGTGYTSTPIIGFTGGGGSGATATADTAAPIFHTVGGLAPGDGMFGLRFTGLTLEGVLGKPCQGIVIHNSYQASIDNCEFFNFEQQAIRTLGGTSFQISDSLIFGAQRVGLTLGYHIGALHLGSSDSQIVNCEVGAGNSGDATDLWNAAIVLDGGADMVTNVIAEGGDVGFRIRSSNNQLTNSRADISYGHGFYITRDNVGTSPPQRNALVGCWAHRNGQHATNTYDNFRIEESQSIIGTRLVGCRSSNEASDAWTHRYGFFDGGTEGICTGFTDAGAGTRWMSGISAMSGIGELPGDILAPASGSTTFSVAQRRFARVNNSTPTLIATLTGGVHGQVFHIQVIDSGNTTIGGAGTGADDIHTRSGTALATVQYGVYTFVCIFTTWYEI